MFKKNLICVLLLAATLTAFMSPSTFAQDNAEHVDLKTGKLAHLAQYIGTYEYDTIFKDPYVKARLDKIVKGRDIDIKSNMEVSSPIGFENDCLVLKGNMQHSADTNRAYLEVCLGQGSVNLGIFDSGAITIYTSMDKYQYLSMGLRTWIYQQNHLSDVVETPENAKIVTIKD